MPTDRPKSGRQPLGWMSCTSGTLCRLLLVGLRAPVDATEAFISEGTVIEIDTSSWFE